MRRIAVAAGVALLAMAWPVSAEEPRRVSGAVHAPTADAPAHLPDLIARCEWIHRGATLFGDVVALQPEEADGRHTFRLVDGNMSAVDGLVQEPANFDIAFYADLGTCGDAATPPPSVRFRAPFTDEGAIPAGSRFAVVTMSGKVVAGYELTISS